MPVDLANKPMLPGRGTPAPAQPFDPSQLTDAKAQIEYMVNTGRMSPEDANAALKPYGAKLDLQAANRGRGPGGRDYYQVTGNHSLLKEFVLPASLMVGAGVGINVLANALAAGATTAGYTAAAPNAVNAFTTTPTLAGVGASGSVPASISGATGVGLGAAPAVSAVPAAGATIGPGVTFGSGAGGVSPAAVNAAANTGIGGAGIGSATATAGTGLPWWGKALIGFGSDAFKTFMANRASGKANEELQKGIAQATGVYKDELGPYMSLGAGAAGSLGHLMGISPASGGSAVGPMQGPTAGAPGNLASIGRQMPANTVATGIAQPRNMVDPAGAMGGGNLASVGTPQAPQNAPAMTRSSFVKMWHPASGEMGEVPADRVEEAKRLGAELYA